MMIRFRRTLMLGAGATGLASCVGADPGSASAHPTASGIRDDDAAAPMRDGRESVARGNPDSRPAADRRAERFSFALIGDVPYGPREAASLPALLEDIAPRVSFGIHVGDIKGGSEPCSDSLLEARISALARSRVPLVYTPGDNEWTDCWRPAAGEHDPLERLGWLRKRVFEREPPLISAGVSSSARDRLSGLARQRDVDGGPPENLLWRAGGVLFLTLNLPGSDNGRRAPIDDANRLDRDAHNRRWLEHGLGVALGERLAAIAIAVQANPGFGRGIDASRVLGDDGYAAFRHDLARLNSRFPGHLLLMHGDTHHFRVDRILPRLTRVECFGSPFNGSWVRIDVDATRHPPFEIGIRHLGDSRNSTAG